MKDEYGNQIITDFLKDGASSPVIQNYAIGNDDDMAFGTLFDNVEAGEYTLHAEMEGITKDCPVYVLPFDQFPADFEEITEGVTAYPAPDTGYSVKTQRFRAPEEGYYSIDIRSAPCSVALYDPSAGREPVMTCMYGKSASKEVRLSQGSIIYVAELPVSPDAPVQEDRQLSVTITDETKGAVVLSEGANDLSGALSSADPDGTVDYLFRWPENEDTYDEEHPAFVFSAKGCSVIAEDGTGDGSTAGQEYVSGGSFQCGPGGLVHLTVKPDEGGQNKGRTAPVLKIARQIPFRNLSVSWDLYGFSEDVLYAPVPADRSKIVASYTLPDGTEGEISGDEMDQNKVMILDSAFLDNGGLPADTAELKAGTYKVRAFVSGTEAGTAAEVHPVTDYPYLKQYEAGQGLTVSGLSRDFYEIDLTGQERSVYDLTGSGSLDLVLLSDEDGTRAAPFASGRYELGGQKYYLRVTNTSSSEGSFCLSREETYGEGVSFVPGLRDGNTEHYAYSFTVPETGRYLVSAGAGTFGMKITEKTEDGSDKALGQEASPVQDEDGTYEAAGLSKGKTYTASFSARPWYPVSGNFRLSVVRAGQPVVTAASYAKDRPFYVSAISPMGPDRLAVSVSTLQEDGSVSVRNMSGSDSEENFGNTPEEGRIPYGFYDYDDGSFIRTGDNPLESLPVSGFRKEQYRFYVYNEVYSVPVMYRDIRKDSLTDRVFVGEDTSLEDTNVFRLDVGQDGYYAIEGGSGETFSDRTSIDVLQLDEDDGYRHDVPEEAGQTGELKDLRLYYLKAGSYAVAFSATEEYDGETGTGTYSLPQSFRIEQVVGLAFGENKVSVSGDDSLTRLYEICPPSDGKETPFRLTAGGGLSVSVFCQGAYGAEKKEKLASGQKSAVYTAGGSAKAVFVLVSAPQGSQGTGTLTVEEAYVPDDMALSLDDTRYFEGLNRPQAENIFLSYTDQEGAGKKVRLDQAEDGLAPLDLCCLNQDGEEFREGTLSAGNYTLRADIAGRTLTCPFEVMTVDQSFYRIPAVFPAEGAQKDDKDFYYLYTDNQDHSRTLDLYYDSTFVTADVTDFERDERTGAYISGENVTPDAGKGPDHIYEPPEAEGTTFYLIHIHSEDPAAAVIVRDAEEKLTGSFDPEKVSDLVYDGEEKTPEPDVTDLAGNTLTKDRDFRVTYSENRNAGLAYADVEGMGPYAGLRTSASFRISPLKITAEAISVKLSEEAEFFGEAAEPRPEIVCSINGSSYTLKEGEDYALSYEDNDMPGTGRVTITGKGNFEGQRTETFRIVGKSVTVSDTEDITRTFDRNAAFLTGEEGNFLRLDVSAHSQASYTVYADQETRKKILLYELNDAGDTWVPSGAFSRSTSDDRVTYTQKAGFVTDTSGDGGQTGSGSDAEETSGKKAVALFVPGNLQTRITIDLPVHENEFVTCGLTQVSSDQPAPQAYYFKADKSWRYTAEADSDVSLSYFREGNEKAAVISGDAKVHDIDLASGIWHLTPAVSRPDDSLAGGEGSVQFSVRKTEVERIRDFHAIPDMAYIGLSWGLAGTDTDTRYVIYRREEGADTWAPIRNISDRLTQTYRDNTVEAGKRYSYAIKPLVGPYAEGEMSYALASSGDPGQTGSGSADEGDFFEKTEDIYAPEVLKISPASMTRLGISTPVKFEASAEDNVKVTSMRIYLRRKPDEDHKDGSMAGSDGDPLKGEEAYSVIEQDWGSPAAESGDDSITAAVDLSDEKYTEGVWQVLVTAEDAYGNIGTDNASYEIDRTGPGAVTNLRIDDDSVTDISATLRWGWPDKDDDDLDHFRVEQKSGDGWVTVSDGSRTLGANIRGLAPATSYTFRVEPFDQTGNRGTGAEISLTTKEDTLSPVITKIAPQGGYYRDFATLRATAADEYNIAWTAWEYSTDGGKTFRELPGSRREYSDILARRDISCAADLTGMPEGVFTFRAIAGDALPQGKGDGTASGTEDPVLSGNVTEGKSAPSSQLFIDRTAPAAPAGLTLAPSETDPSSLELVWQQGDETDLDAYSVERSTDGKNYTSRVRGSHYLSYIDRDLEGGNTYSYRVCVSDRAGNVSPWSEIVSAEAPDDQIDPVVHWIMPSDGVRMAPETDGTDGSRYINITSVASDNRTVSRLELYAGTGTYENYGERPFAIAWGSAASRTLKSGVQKLTLPSGTADGDKVYIKAIAFDAQGRKGERTAVFTVDLRAPQIESAGMVLNQASRRADLSWAVSINDAEDTAGFYIYRHYPSGGSDFVCSIAAKNAQTDYTFTDSALSSVSGSFWYTIRAVDRCGNSESIKTGEGSLPEPPEEEYALPAAVLDMDNIMQVGAEYEISAGRSACDPRISIEEYRFDFGDGTQKLEGKSSSVKHTYKEAGEYTVKVRVTDTKGNTAEYSRPVTVRGKLTLGRINVKVVDENGSIVPKAPVYFDLGSDDQVLGLTGENGLVTFTGSIGSHTIGCYKDHYLPVSGEAVLLPGDDNSLTLTIKKEELITGEFEIHRMSLDEIEAAGIDITEPANQYIAKVNVTLSYTQMPDVTLPVYYSPATGQMVKDTYEKPFVSVMPDGTKHEYYVSVFGAPTAVYDSSQGTMADQELPDLDDVTVVVLDLPVTASALKEFFDVKLHIMNHSGRFAVLDNDITLNVPGGLSIVKTANTESRENVHIDRISGGETKTLEWILRGDKEGEYRISADFAGTLEQFRRRVKTVFEADQPITVYGLSRCVLRITVPQVLQNAGKDTVMNYTLDFFNNGTEPVNSLQLKVPSGDEILNIWYYPDGEDIPEAVSEIPKVLGGNEHVELMCRRTLGEDYSIGRLYDWYSAIYGGYGLKVEIDVQSDKSIDNSIVVRDLETGKLLRYTKVTVNGQVYTTDGEGRIFLPSGLPDRLAISLEGKETITYPTSMVLGDGGSYEVQCTSQEAGTAFGIAGFHYFKHEKGDGKEFPEDPDNAFSDPAQVFLNDKDTVFDLRFKPMWGIHGVGKVVLESQDDKAEFSPEKDGEFTVEDFDFSTFKSHRTIYAYLIGADGLASAPVDTEFDLFDRAGDLLGGNMMELSEDSLDFGIESIPGLEGGKFSIDLEDFPLYSKWERDELCVGINIPLSESKKFEKLRKAVDQIASGKEDNAQKAVETDKLMEKAGGKAQDQDVLSKKLSLKISVVGYMKFQMVHGRLVPIGGKILISLKFKGEYCQQFPTTLVPTYAAVTLGADASAEGEIEKPVIDYPVPYYTDLIIKAEPYGKGAIGVGIHDLVGIEGSVKLSFPISWRPLVKFAKVKYEMQLGAKAYIGPYALNLEELDIFNYDGNLFVKNPDNEFISTEDYFRAQKDQKELENQEAELYDGPSAGSEEGEGGAESGTSAECRAGMAYAMLYQPQNYVLRKQAPEEKDSVYPDARQMIVTAGDTTMMVYLSQDKDRADADSTVAVYSVLRDGEWTDPRPICDDRTADFHPYAAVADGKIYVSWQNACRTFGEEEVDLARFGRYTGIESAVYDPDEDAFTVLGDAIGGTAGAEEESAGDSSTAGSRNAYFNVKTVSAEGKLIRLWQENTDGNLLGTSGTNSLLASSFTDGKWTDPAVLADGLGMIGGYAVWYEDGILYVAYSEKTGTDYQVTDDYEIGLSEWKIGQGQVTGSRITDDPEGARTMDYGPYFAEEDGQLALYWIRDNESMRKILTAAGEDEDPAPEEGAGDAEGEAAQAPAAADTGTLAAAADRKTLVTKNGTFVLFRGSCPEDDDASEVWTQQYLGEGRYSSPVRLTKLKMSLNCFTASPLEDGGILLVCEGRDILPAAGSGDEVKYSGCHFTTVTVSPAIDLAVENADPILFDPAYPGAPVHIHASVRNEGTFPASEGYLVQLLDKTTGEVVSTRTVYEGLGVGESREETIDFYLPLSFAGTTYQIVVTPRIGKDGDESNNTADVEAPGRSLSLDSLSVRRTGNYAYIVIRTENTGAADLEDVSITVSADKAGNEIIGTPISIGTIRHGKTVISSFEIDDLQKTLTFDEENMARLFVTGRAGDVSDMSSCYVFLEEEMSEGQKAADQVTSAIEALGDISLDKKEDVEKARALYNSLDDDARKLVSDQTLATLEEAEKEIIRLEGEKEAAEKAAAEKAAAEKAAAEKAAAEKAAAEKAAAEKEAAEKAAAEKAAAEKAAAEKAAKEKAAAEKAELLSSAPVLPAASVPMKLKQKTNAVFVTGLSSKDYVTGWTSSNPKIVKVTKKGKLGAVLKAGKKKGKAVITVTLASGKTASIVVKTQKKKVATKKIRISCGKKLVLKKGQSLSIGASLVPITSQDKIRYTSSAKKVASVSGKGVIKARKKGKAMITVRSGKKKIKIKVTVK